VLFQRLHAAPLLRPHERRARMAPGRSADFGLAGIATPPRWETTDAVRRMGGLRAWEFGHTSGGRGRRAGGGLPGRRLSLIGIKPAPQPLLELPRWRPHPCAFGTLAEGETLTGDRIRQAFRHSRPGRPIPGWKRVPDPRGACLERRRVAGPQARRPVGTGPAGRCGNYSAATGTLARPDAEDPLGTGGRSPGAAGGRRPNWP
jgi:hypothetical protein